MERFYTSEEGIYPLLLEGYRSLCGYCGRIGSDPIDGCNLFQKTTIKVNVFLIPFWVDLDMG
jgi:hypothetical protein